VKSKRSLRRVPWGLRHEVQERFSRDSTRALKVFEAFDKANEKGMPMDTLEEAKRSVGIVLYPFLIRWVLMPLVNVMIEFLWMRFMSQDCINQKSRY